MEKNRIIVSQANAITWLILAVAVLLFAVVALYYWGSQHIVYQQTGKIRCANFQTQEQAQQTFNLNPGEYKSLDSNHDGIACNDLPKD